MRSHKITTRPDSDSPDETFEIGGWLGDMSRASYLSFTVNGRLVGFLSNYSLYRLAKAIVRHWEADHDTAPH